MPAQLIAIEHLSLDGVFQAPGRADEDQRDGFSRGGWSVAGDDPALNEATGQYMQGGWSMLAGRITYEDLYEAWPRRKPDNPMTKALTGVTKYVATRDAQYRPAWENSEVLAGDAADQVADLKRISDKPLIAFGSGVLLRALLAQGLVDEWLLLIHPLLLGEGRRLFTDNAAGLRLIEAKPAASGVIIARYAAGTTRSI